MIRNRKIVCLRFNGNKKFLKKKSISSYSRTFEFVRMNFHSMQQTNYNQFTTNREKIYFQRSEYDIHEAHGYNPSTNSPIDNSKYFTVVLIYASNKHLKLHLHLSIQPRRPSKYYLNQVYVLLMLTELITDKNLREKFTISYYQKLERINLDFKYTKNYAPLHSHVHIFSVTHTSIKLSEQFLFHEISDPIICLIKLSSRQFYEFGIRKRFEKLVKEFRLQELRYSKMLHDTKEASAGLPKKTYLCPPCDINLDMSSLFSHIRQVHHQFLCLYCLEIFNRAETLWNHLSKNHDISESNFFTAEDFINSLSNEFTIICCTCENIFTKNEEFNEHFCECTMSFSDECLQSEELRSIEKSWNSVDNISIDHLNNTKKQNENSNLTRESNIEPSTSSESFKDTLKNQYEVTASFESQMQLNLISTADNNEKTENRITSKMEARIYKDHNDVDHLQFNELHINSNKLSPVNTESNRHKFIGQQHSDNMKNSKNYFQKAITNLHDRNKYCVNDVDNSTECKSNSIITNKNRLENCEAWNRIDGINDSSFIDANYNGDQFQRDDISTFDLGELNEISSNSRNLIKIDLEIENLLENIELEDLLRYCVKAAYNFCVYCNHVRLIAVNVKQLSLHLLTNHKFQFKYPSNTSEQQLLLDKLKECSDTLDEYYLNFDSFKSETGTHNFLDLKYYECFICRFKSTSHKDLCSHNRKIHQKSNFKCSVCNKGFNSYSELLCHLCSGFATIDENIYFRCCYCSITGLPSAFRLMVHLRKHHNACDICLKIISNQQTLSNHVWKHKLPHSCYKCGISYKHKSDIVKHLFWKHGTESVSCQKCLQKKWPYIYHFCIPPNYFICDDCGVSFTKAVALKVHKRIHENKFPYECLVCQMKFISFRLLNKHTETHNITLSPKVENINSTQKCFENSYAMNANKNKKLKNHKKKDLTSTLVKAIDIDNIPPLNLSSESDNEMDDKKVTNMVNITSNISTNSSSKDTIHSSDLANVSETIKNSTDDKINEEDKKHEEQLMDNIWSNFKTYTESLKKQKTLQQDEVNYTSTSMVTFPLIDHDYCSTTIIDQNIPHKFSFHSKEKFINVDTCSIKENPISEITNSLEKTSMIHKNSLNNLSKNSSPSNNSCSCSCVSDCSCSCSSSSDTSSVASITNSSLIHRNDDVKESKTMEVTEILDTEKNIATEATQKLSKSVCSESINKLITESDLFTSESDTDEDFYEKIPENCLFVNKISKSISDLDNANEYTNSLTVSKKDNLNIILKKNKTTKACYFIPESTSSINEISSLQIQSEILEKSKISPDTLCNKSTIPNPLFSKIILPAEKKCRKRFSVRKRIPKRFYGDSSDEEEHKNKLKKIKRSNSIPVFKSLINSSFGSDREVLQNNEVDNDLITAKDSYGKGELRKFNPPDNSNNIKIMKPLIRKRNLQIAKDKHINYCYCRCPYDERSEMIACDSGVCSIEWFHFKCVGITTPPKGAWYCFDCNKIK